MTHPKRLQGTDGIRGLTASSSALNKGNPLEFYLKNHLLTPQFFKGYCFAFAKILLKEKIAQEGDLIVIGSDPRDPSGEFLEAANQGLEAAGLKACNVGILPTPAIPLYMQHIAALGGIMLTASHNPPDQNGIKLFHPHLGLKFLPLDDEKLTSALFDLDWDSLIATTPEQNRTDKTQEAKEFFVSLHRDPKNSWGQGADFSSIILAIDASKGAATPVAEEIFKHFNFAQVHVYCQTGLVNQDCGVANIEGKEWITSDMVLGENASFKDYQALVSAFELSKNPQVQSGAKELVLLVFDGDADRCFLLYYFPKQDAFRVLSGDPLGLIQARYLSDQNQKGIFIHTVESDFELSKAAVKLGQEVQLTGVGDKWILARACLGLVGEIGEKANNPELIALSKIEPANLDGFEASKIFGEFLKDAKNAKATEIEKTNFLLGLEESGHAITPTSLQTPHVTQALAFAGNGIKAGLNSLAALSVEKNKEALVEETFEAGYKKTLYVYYVDKSKLLGASDYLKAAAPRFQDLIQSHLSQLGPEFKTKVVAFAEEPDLYFIELSQGANIIGAVFLRNSGTEDKSALYLRGPKDLKIKLKALGEELHQELLAGLKDQSKDLCQLELTILKAVKAGADLKFIEESHKNKPFKRILHEMEHKEEIIFNQAGLFKITPKGLYLLNQL